MKYPKYDVYEQIYKRYFAKGVDYFIKEANIQPNDKILDICGGNGRLSKKLIGLSPDVSYIDQEKDMIPSDLEKMEIQIYNDSIEHFVYQTHEKYTKVFCEQAINYWLKHIDVKQFSNLFEKEGLFIFNTFSNKPSHIPMVKEYRIEEKAYLEISYLVDEKVYHIQICQGYEPHFTIFDWISKEQFQELLSPYFELTIKEDGKSALYICKRRNQ